MKKLRRVVHSPRRCAAVLGALCLLGMAPVFAGAYFGAGIGRSDYGGAEAAAQACDVLGFTCAADDTDTAFKVFGGYRFAGVIALEAAFVSLGSMTAELPASITVSTDARGFSLAVVPTLPLGLVSLYAKAGVFVWDLDLDVSAPLLQFEASADGVGTDTMYGVGVALGLGKGALRLEWERYNVGDSVQFEGQDVNLDTEIDLLSAAFVYYF